MVVELTCDYRVDGERYPGSHTEPRGWPSEELALTIARVAG
jgi:hypothetical protein